MLCYVNIVRGVVITWPTRINRRIGRRYASRPVIFPPRRPPRLFVWLSRRRGWSLASGVAVVFPSWPFFFWAAHVRGYPDDGDPVVLSSYSAAAYQIRGAPTIITDPSPPSPPPPWRNLNDAALGEAFVLDDVRPAPFLSVSPLRVLSRVLPRFSSRATQDGDEYAPKRARATDRCILGQPRNTMDVSTTARESIRTRGSWNFISEARL